MASNPHLTRNQLDRFEERLQRERARLLGHTTASGTPAESPGLAEPGDAADVAEVQVERSTQNTLTEAKLEDGSYGLSDLTGEPIPVARLEALPWATTNVEDAASSR